MVRFVFILLFVIIPFSQATAVPNCNETQPVWTDCFGTYTWPGVNNSKGHEYSGEWKNNKKHGFGTFTYPNGDKYIGEFTNDNFEGKGSMYRSSGDIYIGEWKNGVFEGHGTYYFLADNIAKDEIFEGRFKDGDRNGQGTLTFSNGVKGVGIWINGKLNGPSVLYNENGSVYREVIFKDGVIVE